MRNQNSGYSNYQLNKRRESEPEFYEIYEWCNKKNCNIKTGNYRKFTTRACVLIPIEIDRLEYMIKYVIKNYYIKNANQVPNGEFYPKWMYDSHKNEYKHRSSEVNDLQNKLATIKRIANYG